MKHFSIHTKLLSPHAPYPPVNIMPVPHKVTNSQNTASSPFRAEAIHPPAYADSRPKTTPSAPPKN